jgi:hypothetical protein
MTFASAHGAGKATRSGSAAGGSCGQAYLKPRLLSALKTSGFAGG